MRFSSASQDRFGAQPAEWHSDVPPRMREQGLAAGRRQGQVRVVAGARSALFLPFKELGLIVVDEEHDPAYKQEDRVFYNARDMAVVRGADRRFSGRAGLGDALDREPGQCAGRAATGASCLASRYADAALPDIRVIDMRRDPPPRGGFLSPPLVCGDQADACRAANRRCCSSTGAAMRR